jgi:hypothetical protein
MAAAGYIEGYNSNYSNFSPTVVYNNNRPLSLNDSQYQIPQAAYNQKNLKVNRVKNGCVLSLDNSKRKNLALTNSCGTIDYTKDNVASYDEKYEIYNNKDYDRARGATQSFFEINDITRIFFSNKNMQRIQRKIRDEVCRITKGQYVLDCDQDESDLTIIMRGVYFDKGKNLPDNPIRQVKILNQQTVDYLVPDLISNVKQYFGYIRDINAPLEPIARPMALNTSGRRTLPSPTTVWR